MPKANTSRERPQPMQQRQVREASSGRPAYISAPAASNAGSGYKQLAASLGGLSQPLDRLAKSNYNKQDAANQKHAQDQYQLANKKLGEMTEADVTKAIADGTMEHYDDPYFKARVDKMRGLEHANNMADAIRAKIEDGTIDPLGANFDELTTEASASMLEGQSEHFAAGFMSRLPAQQEALKNGQIVAKTNKFNEEKIEATGIALNASIEAYPGDPQDKEAFGAYINKARDEIKGSMHMTYKEIDKIIWGMAQGAAGEGDMFLVEALLTTPRKDAQGKPMPSYAKQPGNEAPVANLISGVQNKLDKEEAEANQVHFTAQHKAMHAGTLKVSDIDADDNLTEAQKRSLLGSLIVKQEAKARANRVEWRAISNNNFEAAMYKSVLGGEPYMIRSMAWRNPETGKIVTLTEQKLKAYHMQNSVAIGMAELKADATAVEVLKVHETVALEAGEAAPGIEAMLSGASGRLSQELIAKGELAEESNSHTKTYETWESLSVAGRRLHVPDKADQEYFEHVNTMVKMMGKTHNEAIAMATNIMSADYVPVKKDMEKAVSNALKHIPLKFKGKEITKDQFARPELERMTMIYAQYTSYEKAAELAVEAYGEQHIVANGFPLRIPRTQSRAQFEETVETIIDDIWETKGGDTGIVAKKKDITVRTHDDGLTYRVYNQETMLLASPVLARNLGGVLDSFRNTSRTAQTPLWDKGESLEEKRQAAQNEEKIKLDEKVDFEKNAKIIAGSGVMPSMTREEVAQARAAARQ